LIYDQLHFYHYTLPQQNNFDSIKKKISDREESKYIAHVFRGGGVFHHTTSFGPFFSDTCKRQFQTIFDDQNISSQPQIRNSSKQGISCILWGVLKTDKQKYYT